MKKTIIIVSMLVLCCISALKAQPHLSRNHYMGTGLPTPPSTSPTAYPYDVKNFSVTPLNGADGPEDIYISTATAFNDGPVKGIFFYPFSGNGSGLDCGSPTIRSRYLYDDPGYADDRAVAIVSRLSTDNSDAVILAQVKDGTNRHGLKILFINHCTGNIIRDKVVFLPTSGYGIHPLDFVYNPSNQKFYICGYIQNDNNAQNRSAFVATLDDNTLAFTMSHVLSWSSGISSAYDYDMAIRIKILRRGPNAGRILVLGGSNIPTASANHSGSLAMLMTPGLAFVNRVSISNFTPLTPDVKDEYAYDASEDVNGNLFIYSNTFWPDAIGQPGYYYPNSKYTIVTRTDTILNVNTTLKSRAVIRSTNNNLVGIWGKNLISDNVIAGYQSYWDAQAGCALKGNAPSPTNITPFFAKINPTWSASSGLNIGINFWKLYHTQTPPTTFYSLGGVESNVSWPTKFATDNLLLNGNTDLLAVVPIWNNVLPSSSTPANKLSYKFIRTDNIGDMDPTSPFSCDNIYTNCIPPYSYIVAKNYEPLSVFSGVSISTNVFTGHSASITPIWVNDSLGCDLNGYYRPTDVNPLNTGNIKIYPNPAYDALNLEFNTENKGLAEICAYDVTGKKVLNVTSNTISGNNRITISLSSLASGSYMIELRNGSEINRQMITKQ